MAAAHAQLKLFALPDPVPVKPAPSIRAAQANDLLVHWPFMREGLLSIKQRLGTHSHWEPVNIYNALVKGTANLFLVERGERVVGFFVTTLQVDPFLGVPMSLFVWIAYSVDGGVEEGHAFLEGYARTCGVEYIEALTARKGLVKRMQKFGWGLAMYIIRKDLYEKGK
jgi:hypothetical protein